MKHEHTGSCKEVFALLSQYLDLELPPEACQEVEAHLNDCPPCIEFAESLKATIDLCRRYAPSDLPQPLEENARRELEAAYRKMMLGRGQ